MRRLAGRRALHDLSASTRDLVRDHELGPTVLAVVVAGVSLAVVRHTRTSVDVSAGDHGQRDEDALSR